jgi:penicillin G amidase
MGWLGALAGAAAAGAWAVLRRPLPQVQGRLGFAALDGPAAIERDERGIPCLKVTSWNDAWRCQGFVHAQDRGFQLDFQRRVAEGRLSEVLGRAGLKADRFVRTLGLGAAARAEWTACPAAERDMLECYAEGVNAGWAAGPLAAEFSLLAYKPRPWIGEDCFLWVKALGHDLACNWESELLRTLLVESGAPDALLQRWSLHSPAGLPVTGGARSEELTRALLEEYAAVRALLPQGYTFNRSLGGSNAWAVGAKRSRNGKPLLACDPHLAMRVPDYWYQLGIEVEDYRLQGATMPCLPGLILGQNGRLAWGVTNAYIDVQDLYLEEVDWASGQVRGPAGPEPLHTRVENIPVRGGRPQPCTLHATPRGPLVQHSQEALALSLAWSGREPGRFFSALAALNRAGSLAQGREALRDWHLPVLNFVLADSESIAHQVAGRVPERAPGSGLVVVPAWDAERSWGPALSLERLPHCIDPPSGYLISANHVLQAPGGEFLSWDFNHGFRAERIEELLLAEEKHDLETFCRVQCDQSSTLARRLLAQVGVLRAKDSLQASALALLHKWDGALSANSPAAAIYQSWLHVLSEKAAATLPSVVVPWLLGERGFHPLNDHPSFATRFHGRLVLACEARDPEWLAPGCSWEDWLQQAFESAVERLHARLGGEPHSWHWGRLHRAHLRHALRLPGLNIGAIGLGGDSESPNQTGVVARAGLPGPVSVAATWRFVSSLAEQESVCTAHCPGQSGQASSRHYRDGVADWVAGRYHRPLQASTQRRLELLPD